MSDTGWFRQLQLAKRGRCIQCGRRLDRLDSEGIFLYLAQGKRGQYEFWVCGGRCYRRFNDE